MVRGFCFSCNREVSSFMRVTLAGLILYHKTSKPYFWVPAGIAWILWPPSS